VSHRPAPSGDSEPRGVGVGQLAVSPSRGGQGRLEPGGDLANQSPSPRPSPRPNPWAATPKSQGRREEADGAPSESPRRQLKPASTGLSKVSRGTARTGRSRGMSNSSSMSTQQLRDHIRNKRAASQASQDAEASWPDPRKYAPRSLYLFNLQNPIRKVTTHLCALSQKTSMHPVFFRMTALLLGRSTPAFPCEFDEFEYARRLVRSVCDRGTSRCYLRVSKIHGGIGSC
jgi:hypothetical protein